MHPRNHRSSFYRLSGFNDSSNFKDFSNRIKLILFHHAGGSVSFYNSWPSLFSKHFDLIGVQLPGREDRFAEPFIGEMSQLIDTLTSDIIPELNEPFVLFGHSLGGIISYELARRLEMEGFSPSHLFISSIRSPYCFYNSDHCFSNYVDLTDSELQQKLKQYGATPEDVFQEPELLKLVINILRNDYKILCNYTFYEHKKLTCPVSVFYGDEDHEVNEKNLVSWSQVTNGVTKIYRYAGGHFYFKNNLQKLVNLIEHEVTRTTNLNWD